MPPVGSSYTSQSLAQREAMLAELRKIAAGRGGGGGGAGGGGGGPKPPASPFDPFVEAQKQMQRELQRKQVEAARQQIDPNFRPKGAQGGFGDAVAGIFGGGGAGAALAVAGPLGAAAAAALVLKDKLMQLGHTVLQLAGEANPAQMHLFQTAVADARAVVGHAFVPVLEKATQFVRLFGDFLASIVPSQNQMRVLLRELDPILVDLKSAMKDLAPVIRDLVIVQMKQFAFELKALGAIIKLAQIGNIPLLAARIGGAGDKELKSSVGAAPQQPAFVGIEQLARDMQLAAFGAGAQDPAKETAKNTRGSLEKLAEIALLLSPLGLGAAIGRAVRKDPNQDALDAERRR